MTAPTSSPPPTSLSQLPRRVWLTTCRFMDFRDLHQLATTTTHNRCFLPIVREALRTVEVTLKCNVISLFSTQQHHHQHRERDALSIRDLEALQLLGPSVRRVRFLARRHCIFSDTFSWLHRVLAESVVLRSVRVEVRDGLDGSKFLLCEDDLWHNWTRFLSACKRPQRRTELMLTVSLARPAAGAPDFTAMSGPELPRRYVSTLHIRTDRSGPSSGGRAGEEEPTAAFLPSFPSLKNLVLPMNLLSNSFLLRLPTVNAALRRLMLTYTTGDGLSVPRWHVRPESWTHLLEALPGLKILCCFHFVQSSPENVKPILGKVFRSNAVSLVSYMAVASHNEGSVQTLLSWCCLCVKPTPRIRMVRLFLREEDCSESFKRSLFCAQLFKVMTRSMVYQRYVVESNGQRHYFHLFN